ncbi:MAG: phenylacetate--CoA ligase [Alphaproteobacteria bacterium]|nr:phenylacetate--CoA ligase [Alphaproteobacteria bacterium]
MDEYYDDLETRSAEAREAAYIAALPAFVRHAKSKAPLYGRLFADIGLEEVTSRTALEKLPVVRKGELIERQRAAPPFGGLAATPTADLLRVFASPGPIYDPEGRGTDYWRLARALWAAGLRRGELVHNCFAYHMTPAGAMLETAAHAIGCPVFPGGTGNTELQARAIQDLRPGCYTGTPSFLRVILDKAAELGADITSLKRAVVSGEALPPSLRSEIEMRGIRVVNVYASADLGLIAYESKAKEGLIVEEKILVEIVRPGTGDPVPEGEVGEVVVTSFNNDYPLIRFGTGDLSAVLPGGSPCGRTNMRIKGWMGRADQVTKVKGMFVHPAQIAEVLKRHPEVAKARLVVDRVEHNDVMTLRCEAAGDAALAARIAESIQAVCKLKGEIELVASGSLPNDGKVIDDVRKNA